MVCVNKWDLNASATETIKDFAQSHGLGFAGLVRYDKAVTEAQRKQKTLPEYVSSGIGEDVARIWQSISVHRR
jgi:MinD superfamily P-loop ATPase